MLNLIGIGTTQKAHCCSCLSRRLQRGCAEGRRQILNVHNAIPGAEDPERMKEKQAQWMDGVERQRSSVFPDCGCHVTTCPMPFRFWVAQGTSGHFPSLFPVFSLGVEGVEESIHFTQGHSYPWPGSRNASYRRGFPRLFELGWESFLNSNCSVNQTLK